MEMEDYYMDDGNAYSPDADAYQDYEFGAGEEGDLEDLLLSDGHLPLAYIYSNCVIPVVTQFLVMIFPSVSFCLSFRLLATFLKPGSANYAHICSSLFGAAILYKLMDGLTTVATVILFAFLSYWLVYMACRKRSPKVFLYSAIILLGFMIQREYLPVFNLAEPWNRVRSIYMIIVMKILSLVYELSYDRHKPRPAFLSYFGYLFFPGSVLFGPWFFFDIYLETINKDQNRMNPLSWLATVLDSVGNLVLLLSCLVMSSCGFLWIFSGHESRWISMTETSMSVRFSHYFISLTAEGLSFLCGVWLSEDGGILRVTNLSRIEFPRSLVEVVMYWNLPMHIWLKKFIHTPLSHLGSGSAALLTFTISSMLHGLNFPVTAVLLSLAIYAFIEYALRKTLAKMTSSCIGVRDCRQCLHRNKSRKLAVRIVNFLFTLLALFHLNYLGVMLESAADSNQGAQHGSVLEVWESQLGGWRKLDFVSHKVLAFTAIAYLGLKIWKHFF